ncbi:hypothetical protein HYPSUDRAFT_43853 [Hypholoma sublateritium FD-334 SS-4]|uniref:Heterokaryon incompatibility domain-containing protein n=1 Tax=Hypholoma sublateritium (strain FD-334 SS-4) TaxID=945553 RepID=A0A0D2NTM6_HYPSF|nr:hypothetical protein HYPSUDRAFT_43853 [Hypholoma sublateritium FD-334 SS-4]
MSVQLNLPKSAQNLLCECCEKIDFSLYNRREDKKYPMPSKRQMRANTSCPFCCLLVSAYILDQIPDDGRHIYAEWTKDRGFNVGGGVSFTVVFLDEDGLSKSAHGMGRYVQPTIHPALVNKWIRVCESHHGQECAPTPNVVATSEHPAGLKIFRMIDVINQCIVQVGHGCRYVALSYMWGRVETVKLLSQNKDQLMAHAGLLAFRNRLPRTINDAIDLLRTIGEQYLWVDSICLLQDDADEMGDAIGKMHLVYRGAVFTILAGAGQDANAGLPGVHFGSRRVIQHIAEVQPGIRMTVIEPLSGYLNASKHLTRGWTLQEHVLSHRLLIFLPKGIFFQCHQNCWSEDTIYDDFPPETFKTYADVIQGYSARELTMESDTLNGAAGVLNVLSAHLKCDMLSGLPTGAFDLAVLFYDPWADGQTGIRKKGFPSWSWAGWKRHSALMMRDSSPGEINRWLRTQTYIVWYKRDPHAPGPSLVWTAREGLTDDDIAYATRDAVIPYGRAESTKSDLGFNETPLSAVEVLRGYPLLQFWAYTVQFTALEHPDERAWRLWERTERIRGRGGELCGGLLVNDAKLLEGVEGPYEYILLSKAASYGNEFGSPVHNIFEDFNNKPIWWVMLIAWDGPVAERRGLGFVYEDCLEYTTPPGKAWNEILLA